MAADDAAERASSSSEPLDSFVSGSWPSFYKSIIKRHAGMPRDPCTDKPYRYLGLRAPLSAFRIYGDDCYHYAVHVHEGAVVAVVCAFIAIVPMIYNLLHTALEYEEWIFYSKTSLFAGCPLSWLHVLCDIAYTSIIVAYAVRWQRQLLVSEARPDKVQSLSEIVEACSIVVLDHDVGTHVRNWHNHEADTELEYLTKAAGGQAPVAISQAFASKRLLHLRQQLIRLQIKRPWLQAYEAAKQSSRRSQTVADKSLRMPRSCYGKLRLYLAGVLDCGGAKTLQECDEEIFKTEEEIAEIVKRPSLLPIIFLTFRDAEAANRIIEAAEDRAVWDGTRRRDVEANGHHPTPLEGVKEEPSSLPASPPPSPPPLSRSSSRLAALTGTGGPAPAAARVSSRRQPPPQGDSDATRTITQNRTPPARRHLEVLHAPNPTDIRSEYLEITWWEKRKRAWQSRFILLPCLVLATTGIVFAAYWQGALKAAPIFLDCVDGMVLAPPCEWGVFARFGRNLANFLWCTALTVASVHLVLQPILILSSARDAHQSHTALMLSLFLRFIIWQVALTAVLCLVLLPSDWHSGFYKTSDSWYFGGATAIVAMLLGDVLLINVIVEGLNLNALFQLLWAYLSSPTQDCLNARVQVHNPSYVAFRYQHILKSWFVTLAFGSTLPILFILHALMMLSSIIVDRLNLLARLQPVPSADAVTARFAATIMLPLCIVIHVILGVGGYAFAEQRDIKDALWEAHLLTSNSGSKPIEEGQHHVLSVLFTCARPLTFLLFSLIVLAILLYELLRQKSIAQQLHLPTPAQLAKYAWRVDYDGFRLASAGAAEGATQAENRTRTSANLDDGEGEEGKEEKRCVQLPERLWATKPDFYAPGAWRRDPRRGRTHDEEFDPSCGVNVCRCPPEGERKSRAEAEAAVARSATFKYLGPSPIQFEANRASTAPEKVAADPELQC